MASALSAACGDQFLRLVPLPAHPPPFGGTLADLPFSGEGNPAGIRCADSRPPQSKRPLRLPTPAPRLRASAGHEADPKPPPCP
eukprot:140061-Pyramimonas_sp.AAC.1